jgi:hypothetical protein
LLHAITIKYNPFVIPEKNNAYYVWVANEAILHMLIKRRHRKQTKAKTSTNWNCRFRGQGAIPNQNVCNGMIIQELEIGKPDGKRATRGKRWDLKIYLKG